MAERASFPDAAVRPQPQSKVLHALLGVLLAGGTAAAFVAGGLWSALGWLAFVAAPSAGLLVWQRRRTPRGGRQIEIGEEGLFADGKLLVPRADMVRAVVVPSEGGTAVSIQRKQGFFVAIDVPDEAAGQRLVRALGFAAEQRTAEFVVDSPLAARLPAWALVGSFSAALAAAAVGARSGSGLGFVAFFAWYALFLVAVRPTKITIGTDGVLLSWLGRQTLLRYSEIADVVPEKGSLRFELAGGGTRIVRAEWTARQRARTQPEMASAAVYMESLAQRIREAKEAAGGADVAVLERRGRPLEEWLRRLRALTDRGAPGFREAPIVPEALWKTVENGHAEPAARAAAAVALQPSLDDGGRERLRVAADVVAAPKLRVALRAAAEGDERALAAALAEMEAAEAARGARAERRSRERD